MKIVTIKIKGRISSIARIIVNIPFEIDSFAFLYDITRLLKIYPMLAKNNVIKSNCVLNGSLKSSLTLYRYTNIINENEIKAVWITKLDEDKVLIFSIIVKLTDRLLILLNA